MTDYCSGLPRVYAANKLAEMLRRWDTDQGHVATLCSESEFGFPGTPATMLVGLSANSTGPTEAITAAGFWEIGLYNVPAGSPSEDPPVPGSAFYRLARGSATQSILGRMASVGRGRSGDWSRDIGGQTAVGILNYREDGISMQRRIAPALRPNLRGGTWEVALSIFGYVESNGAGRAIEMFEQQLVQTPEQQRFAMLCALVANRFEEQGESERSLGYPLVRAMQRMACGKALAERLGQSTAWWPVYGPAESTIEHWLTMARYGAPSGCVAQFGPEIDDASPLGPPAASPALGIGLAIGLTAAVSAAIAGGVWWYRRQQ
mgnify:CR=1 FL=1|jgi:hypothetical protein